MSTDIYIYIYIYTLRIQLYEKQPLHDRKTYTKVKFYTYPNQTEVHLRVYQIHFVERL